MYGKLFVSIYDGTLAEDWRALITFQQMIILCDSDGILDMTPSALQKRTGIPIEHIKAGIEILEAEDPYSRTRKEDGKRIIRIDEARPWGWLIVNHKHYKDLRTAEDRREYMRKYMKDKREKEKLTKPNKSLQKLHVSSLADTDANTIKQKTVPEIMPDWLDLIAWGEFIEHRKSIRKPLSKLSISKNLNVLEANKSQQQEIIDLTISNNWTGLFKPKGGTNETNKSNNRSGAAILAEGCAGAFDSD